MMVSRRRGGISASAVSSIAITLVIVASIVTMAVVLRPPASAPVQAVTIASGQWHPYSGSELPGGGPATAMIVDVLTQAGYAPNVQFTTWSAATSQVADGTALGAFPLVASEQRRSDFLVSDPVITFEYVLFFHDTGDGPPARSAADLSDLAVGVIAGYDYWPEFDQAVANTTEFSTIHEAMVALVEGDVDLVAEGLVSGQAAVMDPGFPYDARSIVAVDSNESWARSVQGLHFMMAPRPGAQQVMDRFNQVLADYQQTADYARHRDALGGAASTAVELMPDTESGLVVLADASGEPVAYAPVGTRAQVMAWPATFTGAQQPSELDAPVLVQVKVTHGPLAGGVFWVEASRVRLDSP